LLMLDRWIPDEDWLRKIRANGEKRGTVSDLNTGLSKQCAWTNNHAILDGRQIFYNKKYVVTCKATATKQPIRFYYVLSDGSNILPTVPSDQGFYQLLWDNQDRSNRCLKRTAPKTSASRSEPPTKKAKASSSMAILPEPPNNRPLSPPPPESFEEANRMVQEAWKVAFPSLRFPVELIGVFPLSKSPLVAAPHEASLQEQPPATTGSSNLKVAINKNLETQLLKERAFLKALKATVAREQTESTPQTRRLLAAFAASNPQVSVMHQEILIALARYTFLLEVQAQANCEKDRRKLLDFCWLKLENVASCSPSASSLTNWVTELAQEQFMIFSAKMEHYNVFCQSDGGQKGQEVRLFTLLDESDKRITEHGSICQFWAGLTYTGKTSAAVAEGTNHSFQKFGRPSKKKADAVVTPAQERLSHAPTRWPPLASGTNMPPPTRADCMIYNPPFDLPFNILSALAAWNLGTQSSCCILCLRCTRS
jgi:hypothetical protein